MTKIVGSARIIEEGFDTDRMLRWFDIEFDPPWQGQEVKRVYHAAITDDGLPLPMQDDMIRGFQTRYARWLGYTLV